MNDPRDLTGDESALLDVFIDALRLAIAGAIPRMQLVAVQLELEVVGTTVDRGAPEGGRHPERGESKPLPAHPLGNGVAR